LTKTNETVTDSKLIRSLVDKTATEAAGWFVKIFYHHHHRRRQVISNAPITATDHNYCSTVCVKAIKTEEKYKQITKLATRLKNIRLPAYRPTHHQAPT